MALEQIVFIAGAASLRSLIRPTSRLDERGTVSYPDGVQVNDGRIFTIYDRNRTTDRQILMDVFTEADVAAGKPDETTRLRYSSVRQTL